MNKLLNKSQQNRFIFEILPIKFLTFFLVFLHASLVTKLSFYSAPCIGQSAPLRKFGATSPSPFSFSPMFDDIVNGFYQLINYYRNRIDTRDNCISSKQNGNIYATMSSWMWYFFVCNRLRWYLGWTTHYTASWLPNRLPLLLLKQVPNMDWTRTIILILSICHRIKLLAAQKQLSFLV